MAEQPEISEQELEQALDHAYLEGVAAAMDEMERKLEAKRQAVAKAKLQERILQQAESVQQQLDEQEQIQMLAMQQAQQERQLLRQQAAQQIEMPAVAEAPKRLPPPQQPPKTFAAAKSNPPQMANNTVNNTAVNPLQLAASLKSSVNGVLTPLLGSDQKEEAVIPPKPLIQSLAKSKSETSDIPGRPPVSPAAPKHGLLAEEDSGILQAQYIEDSVRVRP